MSMFSQQRFVDMRSGAGGRGTVEHCQTAILDHNQSVHRALNELQGATSSSSNNNNMKRSVSCGADPRLTSSSTPPLDTDQSPLLGRQHRQQPYNSSIRSGGVPTLLEFYSNGFYSALPEVAGGDKTIRFQVVVWHVGAIDLIQGRVPLTFRLTIFWNASPSSEEDLDGPPMDEAASNSASQKSQRTWKMLGRQKAYQDDKHVPVAAIEVPAVSILNVVTFDTIGEPEVSLLREDSKLMRWSCMYRATLFQEHWDVSDFPHDEHEISLRLAVLAHRKPGAQWDRNVWKLGLATADDAQGSVRAPEGLVVDHVSIPEFSYSKDEGLKFELKHLDHGPGGGAAHDTCLEVKLRVLRNSSYYDRNIMPLLGMLNFVAISITALEPERFFERGLLTLNITFVEIGMRMTADSKLPTASYQIKMQRILNEYFFGLTFLVLESLLVYELHEWGFGYLPLVDGLAALTVFSHNVLTLATYYLDAHRAREHMSRTTTAAAAKTTTAAAAATRKYNNSLSPSYY